MPPVKIARVAVESPLPQLDRLFDYGVPANLEADCAIGSRVLVPFGKSLAPLDGYVVELVNQSEFEGQLSNLVGVVSPVGVLPPASYTLLRAMADRQAGTLTELTKLAVPKRSVRVEKAWLAAAADRMATGFVAPALERLDFAGRPNSYKGRNTLLAEPRLVSTRAAVSNQHFMDKPLELTLQGWVANLVSFAVEQVSAGQSAILVVPDFRDQNRLRTALVELGLGSLLADFSTTQTNSARYSAYLHCLSNEPRVVVGSRAAAFAPVTRLGGIAIWDDTDPSLLEQTAPYHHTRDVVLLRQQQTGCNLLFAGHSRSPEVQRLVEIQYLTDISPIFAPPKIAVTEPGLRVDSTSYQAAREAFAAGGAVLVQVANTGHSTGTYCASCGERSRCRTCNGPLFIDSKNTPRCRWCSAINLAAPCFSCGETKIRQGVAGSSRTAAELGKAFPGVAVVEATSENRVEQIKPGKRLVVATPGAEPYVDGGYRAVIILDGQRLASRDTLRAAEQAVSLWSNAISLLATDGRCVAVGLATELGKRLALWDQRGIAATELANRRELRFPPHCRMASLAGPRELIDAIVSDISDIVEKPDAVEVLGPLLQQDAGPALPVPVWRYLIRYEYSVGEQLAKELKGRVLLANAGSKAINAKSGRASRSVKLRMDDSEVI